MRKPRARMQLFVGVTTLLGRIERYAERFDLLELRAEPGRLPNAKTLKRFRAQTPSEFHFSLLVPPKVVAPLLAAPDSSESLVESAAALAASWVVLQTGPDVGPSARARARIAALAERLGAGRRVAWEPHGPWEPDVAREFADQLGLHFVEDLSVVDGAPGPVVYTRLRALGPGAELRSGALERLAEQVADAEEVFVVIEGRGSAKARSRIEQALGLAIDARAEDVETNGASVEGLEHDEDDEDDEDLGGDGAEADDELVSEEDDEDEDEDDEDDEDEDEDDEDDDEEAK